jgi:hypothetical protein
MSLDIRHRPVTLIIFFITRMEDGIDDDADPKQPGSESTEAHYVWQYFTLTNHTEAKKG